MIRRGPYIKEVYSSLKEGVYWTGKKALYLTERNRSTLPSGTNTLESCNPVCVRVCVRDGVCGRKIAWRTEGVIEDVCFKGIMGVQYVCA